MITKIWKPKDWYKFIMRQGVAALNDAKLEYPKNSGRSQRYLVRQRALDSLVYNIIHTAGEELSDMMKKKLLRYVQRRETINFMFIVLTVLLLVSGTGVMIFMYYQRLTGQHIGWIVGLTITIAFLLLVNYIVVRKGIRDAIIRACSTTTVKKSE